MRRIDLALRGKSSLEERFGLPGEPTTKSEPTTKMQPLGNHLTVDEYGIIWEGEKRVGVRDIIGNGIMVHLPPTSGQDPRASAAKADVPSPCLLYTFLGRVSSQAGRELERVMAVRVSPSGASQVYLTPDEWQDMADSKNGIRATDLWKKHFESWADEAHQRAAEAALACFRPVAKAHVKEREGALKQERQDQDEWLRKRAEEITGTGVTTAIQPTLFDAQDPAGHRLPAWQTIDAPADRLASFATDGNQPPAKRSEADGVLRIYRQRMAVLDSLSALGDPEVIPLGVLVLVPRKR